jgi:trans-L-3-hydroxyproline dehydratase
MYGVIPVTSTLPGAKFGVLFMHHSGYSTMCGHAVIAIGKWAISSGRVPLSEPVTQFVVECPCGPVALSVAVREGAIGQVSFDSVAAFVSMLDLPIEVPGFGGILIDIAYGGAFYAIVPASRLGLSLDTTPIGDLVCAASAISEAVRASHAVHHPTEADLSFLYGTILTDERSPRSGQVLRNLCEFAGGQVDRSPTGSGVTARMALYFRRGMIGLEQSVRFAGITGDSFSASVVQQIGGTFPTVNVRVSGRAFFTGSAQFTTEPDDPLKEGFSLEELRFGEPLA